MAHNIPGGTRKGSRYHRLDDIPTNTFTPQTYQIQLLDAALKKNTLLCLGSNQGKVFLALMVAKELASATRQPPGSGHKCTFYITDSEDEVDALYQTLPHHTDLQIGRCPPYVTEDSGKTEEEVMSLEPHHWHHLMESNNILLCHGPAFVTALQHNCISLTDVNLLIFDDCHRSVEVENHSYAEIVNHVRRIPVKSQPHILGVTTSIAGTDCSDPGKLRDTIASMEKTMNAYAETSMLILSERFGCRPRESVIQCEDNECDDEQIRLTDMLQDILEQTYDFFNDCRISVTEDVDNRDPTEIPIQVLSQCLNILGILGSWCTSSISEYFVMQLDKIVKYEKNDIHKKFLRCIITTLRFLTRVFEMNFHPDYDVDELLEYTTPKVRELVKVLRNYKPEVDFMIISNDDSYDNEDDDFSDLSDDDDSIMSGSDGEEEKGHSNKTSGSSKPMHIAVKRTADGGHERVTNFPDEEEKNLCGIIFVENRYIAFGLNKVIEEVCSWDENLCFVKSCHITGQGLRGANGKQKTNRTYKRQEEALRKFRTQECNLVIATLELEEGIDIPKCNLVVRFDPPQDYRSYTLSKGRARARDALYVILLENETFEEFNSDLKVFKGIEQVLLGERSRKHFTGNDAAEEADDEKEDESEEDDDEDIDEGDILPPYKTSPSLPNSPHVTMQGAIALINRYCAKLPSDAFTHLTPHCRVEKLAGDPQMFVAFLRLPINSPIKEELKGPVMRSKKLAKMAVALKMCEKLHMKSELDDNLVPVGKEMFLYEEEEEWADEEDMAGQARPGTTKRKQYYIKKAADALVQSLPKPQEPCYLYLINLRLTGPITDEQNTRGRVIYAPEDTTQTLGILMAKPVPQMPYFPVYTRSGEVTASVDLLQDGLVFTEDEISQLLKFHHFLFSGVLHLEKDPMEFNADKSDVGCIVVPLNVSEKGNGQLDIEWKFVDKVIQFMKVEKRAGFSRKNTDNPFQFCIDDFKDAVVMPSYRNIDQPQHFYVAEIRRDLNPLSPFPSPELYKTFQDYYTTKYGLVITNTEQPLLDVDHTSARLNLLTPRYMNQKGVALPTSSAETKRARRENLQQKQILVPELCDVHVFPASLWRKTVCLPAILYRANYLLLAEELRCKISRETGIGVETLPDGFTFPQLDFGFETSPEKLKEADSNNSKKSSVSSSPDMKNIRNDVDPLKDEVDEKAQPEKQSSDVEHRSDSETSDVKEKQDLCKTSPVNDEGTLGKDLKTTQEKIDSTPSSDSDSGILSSGSDTSIGLSNRAHNRDSPELSSVVCANPDSATDTETTELSDKSAMQISKQIKPTCNETNSLGPNLSPWCSNQDNICNMTSHGSSVPCSHGNDHDQCNILCTDVNVVAEPSYTSCVNEQPGKSSSTISTSVIISDCNAFTHTTSATSTSPCIISWADSPVTSSTCDSNNVPISISTTNLPTAASVTITTQCSDQSDLISATSTFVGAKLDAASRLPFSSSLSLSSSSSLTSYSPMSSSDSSPATICSFTNETAAVDQKCLETNIPQSTSSCAMFSSPTMRDQNPTVSSNGNVTHSLSSPAAANEASSQEKPEHTAPSSTAEPHKTYGCESLKGPLDSNALLREPYYVDDHKLAICDILSHTKQSSHHTDFTCTSDHPSNCHTSDLDITTSTCTSSQLNSKEYSEAEVEEKCKNNHDKGNISHIISGESSDDEMVHVCKEKHSSQPKRSGNTKPSPEVTGKPPKVTTPTSVSDESSSTSSSENPSDGEAAIIMNMLGQELSGLDIDLIIPQADTSETFHASESQWGTTNSENKAWENMTSSWDKQWTNGAGNPQQNFENKHENSDKTTEEKESNDKGHAADADVIKFSFGTDKLEKDATCIDEWKTADKGGEEMDPSKDRCAKETKEDSSTHKVPKAEENTDSSVKSPSVQSDSQRSTAEDNTASFDIGVWNTKKKRRDREESPNQFLRSPAMKPAEINDSASMLSSHLSLACNGHPTVSLDEDRDLKTFVGPSPCLIMQALTMSNANDFFSLERLETIGDSFLKYAITVYLYCSYPGIHEGKLSYLRSKQVSNYNLYRLGRRKCLAECMVSTKFEPYENWLPPGFIINEDRRRGPVPKVVIVTPGSKVTNASRNFYLDETSDSAKRDEAVLFNKELEWIQQSQEADQLDDVDEPGHTPYSLQLHHGLPDKSVADCVEALIGCYLTTCGRKAALMFMSWLGLKVLPKKKKELGCNSYSESLTGKPFMWKLSEQEFDELRCPPSPMFSPTPENQAKLNHLLQGFDSLEEKIDYKFRDRSYLLQAFTHASYHYNTITDCYQRVEFLGDAILDYVITRHLYEDSQKYSPGILTDLRSALVNNNIFAALAVKWGFHKYFKAISPSLFHVIDKFVKRQKEKNQDDIDIDEEYRELSMDEAEPEEGNDEDDEEEEVEMEIPKALGDIFESVAGAIYLDSGMSLDAVWRVYYRMMKPHIDKYLKSIPKSPVRELLETEPETAKFERPERTMNGKVRVTVNVVGKGVFSGVGRNYRIAKSAAAKKALRSIRIVAQNLIG